MMKLLLTTGYLTYLILIVVAPTTNAFQSQSVSDSLVRRTFTTSLSSSRSPKTVSATGDYFSHLGPTTGLPDFSKMKVPEDAPNGSNPQRIGAFVDEAKAISLWDFPYTPDQLVAMATHFYGPEVLIGLGDDGACLADDFEFCGSGFGPVGKDAYLQTLTAFGLDKAFETVGNIYGFYADPLQPGRVWYFNRSRATQIGRFLGTSPKGKEIQFPPQIEFIDFNVYGKVKQHGFYTIDRRQGNTGGLGGVYGYMYAVGKSPPFPEAKPYKPSFRHRVFNFFVHSASGLKSKKSSAAKKVNGAHVNGAAAVNGDHVNGIA